MICKFVLSSKRIYIIDDVVVTNNDVIIKCCQRNIKEIVR